jgi:UDPglucose--hexose-1-phosphate uridylyltransferase
MDNFNIGDHTHTRKNILTGEWILVSPHRTKRPWQGKVENLQQEFRPEYDPICYLCPGNKRAGNLLNPDYNEPFSFVNDFASLVKDTPIGKLNIEELLQAESDSGICKVIVFSPNHQLTLPELKVFEIEKIIALWCKELVEISKDKSIKYIQIFENKGEIMGCSNPHPHGQIWAQSSIPLEINKETVQQKAYFEKNGKSLLSAYLTLELKLQERVVFENKSFVVIVPFWATWPYETILISKRHVTTITEFEEEEKKDLAITIKEITTRYDNLFQISFPYSSGIHQAPINDGKHSEWHWHMHFYPPLLRSSTVKKFMVGYELLANPQRDITPENAAEKLKSLSSLHYKEKK